MVPPGSLDRIDEAPPPGEEIVGGDAIAAGTGETSEIIDPIIAEAGFQLAKTFEPGLRDFA